MNLLDNPGAPFTLAMNLARTDAEPWAPGPAAVVRTLAAEDGRYGGCMAQLGESVAEATGLDCPGRWVTFGSPGLLPAALGNAGLLLSGNQGGIRENFRSVLLRPRRKPYNPPLCGGANSPPSFHGA